MRNMNNTQPKLPWRMAIGHYALNKLACGGLAFSLLSLLSLLVPLLPAVPSALSEQAYSNDWPTQLWAYGLGLPTALAADVAVELLFVPDKRKQAALYFTTGFGLFLILAYFSVPRLTGITAADIYAGIIVAAIYMTCRKRWMRESFVPIMLAFVLPLICMIITHQ
ncbi:hypothetical protein OIN60_04235 [Paenibacillus sp. P96]|uniref:Uncharacterized protein n=1 Tax=Paenibacillus zeirhizosphaerae TaxID=2987519 RepID=A0ABT9FMP1_9BACL|nr:hypothetical protein [Paenibacillus sp. P96]MDP4095995.1 hypothetical protein [Paenibacillus sp. P96]